MESTLTHGKCHGLVGITLFDGCDNIGQPLVTLQRVLTALQHKGIEPGICGTVAATEYLVLAQTVSRSQRIRAPQAAVMAIITAIGTDFNECAQVDPVTETVECGLTCSLKNEFLDIALECLKKGTPFIRRDFLRTRQRDKKSIKNAFLHFFRSYAETLLQM